MASLHATARRRGISGGAVPWLVCGALLFAPASGFARQGATPADSTEVANVEFVGSDAFTDDVLAAAIVTARSRCNSVVFFCWLGVGSDPQYLDARTLGADVVRLRVFYYQQGYREAKVTADTVRSGDAMRITFHVEEGTPVRVATVSFDSAAGIPTSALRNLPIAPGRPLSLVAYEATRDTIINRLNNHGYALADVLAGYMIPRDSPHVAHVSYELIPGSRARFGAIEVAGADRVTPAVVRRMLTFAPGDLYTREAVLRSQRNLFSQEVFRHAEIRAATSAATDTLVDVVVQVNEGDLHRVRAGLGLSTSEYLNAEGRWTSRNFFGGARRLEWRGRVANLFARQIGQTLAPVFEDPEQDIYSRLSGSLAVDFSQPWFFNALNTLGLGMYAERRIVPQVFVRTSAGGHVSFTRALGPGQSFALGYRPELTRLETAGGDRIFCLGFIACDLQDIDALRDPHWLSPIAVSYALDRSNSIFAPNRGFVVRLDAEHAGTFTASDFSYTRLMADLTDYSTLSRGLVLASRLRSGWAGQLGEQDSTLGVHPQKRFFAGGPNSVRGFAQYRLGPKLLTVDAAGRLALPSDQRGAGCTAQQINVGTCDPRMLADSFPDEFRVQPVGGAVLFEGNFELRFPLLRDHVSGAAFLDFGQVWAGRDAVDLGGLAWTPGFGVRYFSAVGPIRIDIGYNPGGAENVTVVTTEVEYCPEEGARCQPIQPGQTYDYRRLRNTQSLRELGAVPWGGRNRFQFHFSIGQAF